MTRTRSLLDFLLVGIVLGVLASAAWAQFSKSPTRWDASTRCTSLTLGDGTMQIKVCDTGNGTGYVIPAPCPADLTKVGLGFCADFANGRFVFKDATGIRSLK